ncbi:hypothetical protein D3OALGA1CA_2851 [Olavius algarvensis associated proteobacterium Delta 3]|nr:hypothetical protein D3OALGA1CA_2851 [Olavius algarvensis associated proteobacterium Delta 3]CAB5163312.1 hypothetical protein D3OALGB2SA_5572 [Olavius algarvensis associated proteobacterium Delta 3]
MRIGFTIGIGYQKSFCKDLKSSVVSRPGGNHVLVLGSGIFPGIRRDAW